MKRPAIILLGALVPVLWGGAQASTPPVITLQQSIDAALASGLGNMILQGNLDVAQAQQALTVSKNSFSLSGSAGYGATDTFGDSLLLATRGAGLTAGATQGPQAGLSLSSPL
jgi:hypothetical protein